MAWSLVSSVSVQSSGAASAAINTTGATLIVVIYTNSNGSVDFSTDSAGNTWTKLTPKNAPGLNVDVAIFYKISPSTSASHTFTLPTSNFPAAAIMAFSGGTPVFDKQAAGNTSSTTTATPGSVTPTDNGALIVTGAGVEIDFTGAVDSGFTMGPFANFNAGVAWAVGGAWLSQGTSGAVNPGISLANVIEWADVAAVFSDSGAASTRPIVNINTSTPSVPPPPLSFQTWTWSYNQNLIGQDILPAGRKGITFDLAPRTYLPSGKTWTWQYNPNLVGKDVFPPGRIGVLYDDPSRGYLPPGKTWTWQYNLNLIAKDVLPPGRQSFERPIPVLWYREWTQNLLLSTLSVTVQTPFNQYNWPLPIRAPQPDRTQTESLILTTLLSQDAFPPGQQRTEAPPPVSWRRDWTQSLVLSTLSGQDQLPSGVISNRIIVPDPWRRDWSQNLLLSTLAPVIQVPFNQYDWPLPQRAAAPGQTWTLNLLLSTLAPPVVLPFNQYDWPVPQRFSQPDRSFAASFNLNLIAQDKLPFRQSDWPLPRGYYYPLSVKSVSGVNPNLFPPPPPPIVTGELRNPPFIGQTTGQMMTWGTW